MFEIPSLGFFYLVNIPLCRQYFYPLKGSDVAVSLPWRLRHLCQTASLTCVRTYRIKFHKSVIFRNFQIEFSWGHSDFRSIQNLIACTVRYILKSIFNTLCVKGIIISLSNNNIRHILRTVLSCLNGGALLDRNNIP